VSQTERRRFTRIEFDADTELTVGDQTYPVELVDISLKGALIKSDALLANLNDEVTINIHLAGDDVIIRMPAEMTHASEGMLGFRALSIDLESISHLRRLVELNIGDETLLERELEHLFPNSE